MSKVGKKLIALPNGVEVAVKDGVISVKGPKGSLDVAVNPLVRASVENGNIKFEPAQDKKLSKFARSMWGTNAALTRNPVKGVFQGF